jgi:hypothetical protein
VKFVADPLLEEDGFELAVPPRRERLWAATPGKHCRFGPEPVSGSAFRAAVSNWQRPEEPFARAGPMVRIRFPPAGGLRTIGSAGITGLPPGLDSSGRPPFDPQTPSTNSQIIAIRPSDQTIDRRMA